ncbi:helix-turn-helix domain-containing protein [Pseudomonas atacamensis]|uniref:Helix-turn-helix domain-containing protein n=1 Tax=Pseudomonas atacamensis TaxID=2565368 RepID=A0AAQ2D6C8_9PSED|nr:helix-turn-helix domain-containing protein [Pseudomonas atacamensis]
MAGLTNRRLADEFRSRYPKVNLQLDPVITESDRLICAGSSAAYLIQTIHIIKHFSGPTIASQCAKTMLIDTNRTKQLPYLPFLAEKEHSDSLVHKAQQQLQKNMRTELRISMLADSLGASERTLIRRFRLALEQSPLNYLQGLRIDVAQNLLRESDQSIEVIATSVGYTDTSSFCRLFKQKIGHSPGAYRSKFR